MTIIGTHNLNIFNLWVPMVGLAQKFMVLNQEYSTSSSLTDVEQKYCDNAHILVSFRR